MTKRERFTFYLEPISKLLFQVTVSGILSMNPNYQQMSFTELRAYVMENRDDIEALRFLMSKHDPNSKGYPTPITEEEMQAQMEIIRRKSNGK